MQDLVNRGLIFLNNPDCDAASRKGQESTIIVTGVARGGTTMLAQVAGRLGVFLGDLSRSVVAEDSEILNALRTSDTCTLDSIISRRNSRFPKWGFKAPNLHRFLPPAEERRFRNPRFLVVFRDPVAIAKRNELSVHLDVAQAIRQAGRDLMKLTSYVEGLTSPALLLSYEKALQNSEHVIEALISFCDLKPTDEQKAAALATINPGRSAYLTATVFAAQSQFRGQIDRVMGDMLRGWCCYRESPEFVKIEVFADERNLGVFVAEDHRQDLRNAGVHLGNHGFSVNLTSFGIRPSAAIWVRPSGTTLALPNSGRTVDELRRMKLAPG
jgi:hypothetical protein